MDLIARFKGMWRRHDEKLEERALNARAAGDQDAGLVPGLSQTIDQHVTAVENTAEHEQPE